MLFSICIPTYSRLHYLKEAVCSVQKQAFKDVEICISQDPQPSGADKDILQWCDEMTKKGLISFNLNKKRLGLSGNFNKLIQLAKGDYVLCLGDDDLLAPDFLEVMAGHISRFQPDIIFSNQYFIDSKGAFLDETTHALNKTYKRDKLQDGVIADTISIVLSNSVPLSASLIKRDMALQYPFDENMNTPELPFFLQVAVSNASFYYVNKQLAYYRLHKNSATSKGLGIHRLVNKIIDIEVPEEHSKAKEAFISPKMVTAVNKALLDDKKLAKRLIYSQFYKAGKLSRLIQQGMLILPQPLLRLLLLLKQRLRT